MNANIDFDRRGFIKGAVAATGAACLSSKAFSKLIDDSLNDADSSKRAYSWGDYWRPESPGRLPEITKKLCEQALSGVYGKEMKESTVKLDKSTLGLSNDLKYGHAAILAAKTAPLKIVPGEKIVGSATYLEAVQHRTAILKEIYSTSHTTVGFDKVLKYGYKGLRKKIGNRISRGGLNKEGSEFLQSMLMCLDGAEIWHKRYMNELTRLAEVSDGKIRQGYIEIKENLANVPGNPAKTFKEAVQSLWFSYAYQRLMGSWLGIGRIDKMLGNFLKHDLKNGKITIDEARDILAHFWIKGAEWAGIQKGSGDAQHYQNIVLSGIDADGNDVTNEVTYLVLDIVEELGISDFPIAVRVNKRTSKKLFNRIAEVQRHGGGIVAIYNEEVAIKGMIDLGIPLEEAREFANDGCWETLVPGKTAFTYLPFDGLTLLHEVLGLHDSKLPAPGYNNFKSLYDAYLARLQKHIDYHNLIADGSWADKNLASPLVSLLVDDCIEKARSYHNRGAKYSFLAPHIGGLANVVNALYVIKKLVFEEKFVTLSGFIDVLRNNWEGHENLRQLIVNRFRFYGNDNDEVDSIMKRVFNDYTDMVAKVKYRSGVYRPAGISTFGREIEWRHPRGLRKASPDGHKLGAVLATNFSPSPGTDVEGPTSIIKS